MIFSIIEGVEGSLVLVGVIVNICIIDVSLIPAAIVFAGLIVATYYYSKPVMTTCKELDLQSKSPIIQSFNENIQGLTQIRIY